MHYKSKRFTWEEIAEELQLKVSQLQGLFHHNAASFTDKHTGKVKHPGRMTTRMFTQLGVARFRFLGQAMMKRNAKIAAKLSSAEILVTPVEQANEIKVTLAPPVVTQKYPNIEKISKPVITAWNSDVVEDFKASCTPMDKDDEVLDIAVKIVAERQAFNKIKDEIVVLRHENTRMKSLLLEIGALVGGV